jgi:DNA repair protein RecN (Recombination protein N)
MLKKKYGGTIESVLRFRNNIEAELNKAENFNEAISILEDEIVELRKECGKAAAELSGKRNSVKNKIEQEVIALLKTLGIEEASFVINISQNPAGDHENYLPAGGKNYKYGAKGFDEVEFFISTNKGEDLKPLAKVASGGEISRIMLALKSILAKSDKLPLLIFDEIDTGVSGRIAQRVGSALKNLASFHQIIAITHLPQIAGQADHHYLVEKSVDNERVISTIKILDDRERLKEVAKLMSGEDVTSSSLSGAKELMNLRDK